MAGMYDTVVKLLERDLEEARNAYREGKASNAPNLKDLEKAVQDAQQALERYQSSNDAERRRLNDKYLKDFYDSYGSWVADLVKQFPELANLFSKAVVNGWNETEFMSNLYKTSWWAQQGKAGRGNTWLTAFEQEHDPRQQGTWVDRLKKARDAVNVAAKKANVILDSGQVDNIARMYLYSGWDADPAGLDSYMQKRATNPNQKVVTQPGDNSVAPTPLQQSTEAELKDLAESYGISLDPKALADWIRQINDPKVNVDGVIKDQFVQWLVNESKSRYGAYADQIDENTSLRQLTGSYTSTLAQLLELNPSDMKLGQNDMDPLLKRALTNINPETGKPERIPLWKFEQMVRQDDRWQLTNNARSTYMDAGTTFLRALGFVG